MSEWIKWNTCTCWRDGIRYSCYRPEYFLPEDMDTTTVYPCMEKEAEG